MVAAIWSKFYTVTFFYTKPDFLLDAGADQSSVTAADANSTTAVVPSNIMTNYWDLISMAMERMRMATERMMVATRRSTIDSRG